jgi:hypothetical protein
MTRQRLYPILALIVFIISIWYVFYDFSPQYQTDFNAKDTEFSTDRAFEHVQQIAKRPHYVGTTQHSVARNYIIKQLEELGLRVHTQQDYTLTANGEFTIPQNIVTRIEGKNPEAKALLLLSHYDSEPHSSNGASDAASGVAAIIESLRAYKAKNVQPEHDIIICFTDAEELGLIGAQLFAGKHPWAKNIGLVLNFEARGSGGPSIMIAETNNGNAKMIKAFSKADLDNVLGTSLMYSFYKIMPNSTDSTVFREKADIPGFFFAFIDDHFDYHTALDIPKRLNKRSLAHQGQYAFNLLNYFSQVSLDDKFESSTDLVYFNLPEFGLFYYPFSWNWYLFGIFFIMFLSIIYWGIKHKAILRAEVFKGFIPFLLILVFAFALGYFGWQVVLMIYPEYNEILHGFPYTAHNYIFAFVCFILSFSLSIYARFQRNLNPHNSLVAPLLFWFIICGLINVYLPGAGYFTIALGFAVIMFAMATFREVPNLFVTWIFSLPAIGLIVPLIQFFPIGLGMNMIIISTMLTALVFALLYGFIGYLPFKQSLSGILFVCGTAFIIVAHVNSEFTKENPKPNSLVYSLDHVTQKAYWNTYDKQLDEWNNPYFKDTIFLEGTTFQSKYSTKFTQKSEAQFVNLKPSYFDIDIDNLDNDRVKVNLRISPRESINRIEIYANKNYNFEEFQVNQQKADSLYTTYGAYHIFKKRYSSRLITYHVVNQEDINIEFVGKLPLPEFEVFEIRFDLLQNEKLKVPKRPPNMIPKPFVINDAIILKQSILFK